MNKTSRRLGASDNTGRKRALEAYLWGSRLGFCVILALGVAGCGRIGLNDPLASSAPKQTTYEPLPAAPTAPVTSTALPPPPPVTAPTVGTGTPVDPLQPGQPPANPAGTAVAAAAPTAVKPAESVANDKGSAINRSDFIGGWTISSGADNCKLFTSLTAWSGGSRASTKGCNSVELQHIAAWDVVGKQIALKGGDGSVLATLTVSGQEKYSGTTSSKQSIALSR